MKPAIILDHDIGTNPDDFFALLMLLNSPAADLALAISGNNFPKERAMMARRVMDNEGAMGTPSLSGEATGHIEFHGSQYIGDYSPHEIGDEYVEKIKEVIDANKRVVYLAIQGLSNLAKFLRSYPEYLDRFDIVHMGMALPPEIGYIAGGTNMEADPLGAKYVYELQPKRMKVVGSHTTINDDIRVHPETALYKKLKSSEEPNHRLLAEHLEDYHARRGKWPALHDPLAASVALGKDFVTFAEVAVDFNEAGGYKLGQKTQVVLSEAPILDPARFMEFVTDLL